MLVCLCWPSIVGVLFACCIELMFAYAFAFVCVVGVPDLLTLMLMCLRWCVFGFQFGLNCSCCVVLCALFCSVVLV